MTWARVQVGGERPDKRAGFTVGHGGVKPAVLDFGFFGRLHPAP